MGQKSNPTGLRIGVIRTWSSKWYEEGNYAKWLKEDLRIKKFIKDEYRETGINRIEIERAANKVKVSVYTAKPGIIIGKKGAAVEVLKEKLRKMSNSEVFLNIQELRKAEMDAQLVAEGVARNLEHRVSFRRAMKKSVQTALKLGAKGIRVNCAGRLGGAEMSRTEWYREGRVPLHTLRADIDYGFAEAKTAYGIIGIKVWIFKGEILGDPLRVNA
ncbi:MAG: 30S ribosomal protein S3 [Proteobacteria bacterium]|nr:30S ribosomal protein S3 [Pseudomonadota bacterium]MBQ9244513.1 30S ribosomal protein S3 [Pseudomonadota bacterium]